MRVANFDHSLLARQMERITSNIYSFHGGRGQDRSRKREYVPVVQRAAGVRSKKRREVQTGPSTYLSPTGHELKQEKRIAEKTKRARGHKHEISRGGSISSDIKYRFAS